MRPESTATAAAVHKVVSHEWKISQAARYFGISRSTLQRALKRRKKETQCTHCYGAGYVEVTFDFSDLDDIRVECPACR